MSPTDRIQPRDRDAAPRRIELPDGAALIVRAVAADDKELLVDGFKRLSPTSRYRRFFSSGNALSARQLRYFTEVDHHRHEAIGALDEQTGQGVGVARFIRDRDDPATAEVAVAVADDWQGRGVGTALLALLIDRAREEGVRRFSAVVLAGNPRIVGLLREFGEPRVVGREGSTVDLLVELPPHGLGDDLPRLLAAAARGHVRVEPHSERTAGTADDGS